MGVSWCGPCNSTCCWAGNLLIYDHIPAKMLEAITIGQHPAHKSSWEAVMPNALHRLLNWCLKDCSSQAWLGFSVSPSFIRAVKQQPHLLQFCFKVACLVLHKHRRQLMYELILFPLALSHKWKQQLTEVLNVWIIQVPAQPTGNYSCLCCPCCLSLMFTLASTDFANGMFSFGAQ